jgi:hypothetical protein
MKNSPSTVVVIINVQKGQYHQITEKQNKSYRVGSSGFGIECLTDFGMSADAARGNPLCIK